MAKFEDCIGFILDNEGEYSHDPGDPPTKFGITDIDLADWKDVKSVTPAQVKAMTMETALEIYRAWYWAPLSLDLINDSRVATALLDVGVNRGVNRTAYGYGKGPAGQYAQEIASLMGHPCGSDTIIGPKTAAAVNKCNPEEFIRRFSDRDALGYQTIYNQNPKKWGLWIKGWLNRARRILALIKTKAKQVLP